MDESTLLHKAKFYAKMLWNAKYNGEVIVKKGMKVQGRCWLWDKPVIHLSNKLIMSNNDLFIDDVLLHELTHWYCFINGEDYRDGKADFENRLSENGINSTRSHSIYKNSVTRGLFINGEYERVAYEPSQKLVDINQKFRELKTEIK